MKLSAYSNEVLHRLRSYYGSNAKRIVCFGYEVELIEILMEPEVDLKLMKKHLLGILDHLLVVNLLEIRCLKICFVHGFGIEKEFIFVNINKAEQDRLFQRGLDVADYVSEQEYNQMRHARGGV